MHATLRLLRYRDNAQRVARKLTLHTPVTLSPHFYAMLEQIQDDEDGLRWLLSQKPRQWRQREAKQRDHIPA